MRNLYSVIKDREADVRFVFITRVSKFSRVSLFSGLNAEDITHHGRIDLTLKLEGQIWLFEFKVAERSPMGSALKQLKEKGYADKYRALGQPIALIGIAFSEQQRQLVDFEVERLLHGI